MPSVVVRPSGNVNALWNTNTYTLINENITVGQSDTDQVTALEADSNEDQAWLFTLPDLGANISISQVVFYGLGYTDSVDLTGSGLGTINGSPLSGKRAFTYNSAASPDWVSGVWDVTLSGPITSVQFNLNSPTSIGKGNSYNVQTIYGEFFYSSGVVAPGQERPESDGFAFYNDFVGNFGISNNNLNHTEIINVLQSLRSSGYILQDDPSLTAAQDGSYVKIKVLPPNSGTVYERIRFKPTQIESHFIHLASGLNLDMRYDNITNSSSGIMEVWLDASGLGYLNPNQSWWYSGPIGLPSGMDQRIQISKNSLNPINGTEINKFGNITIHVKYENQNNNINELNIYSLKLCGDHAYTPQTFLESTTLYTKGGAFSSGNIPLYVYGLGRDSGIIPLFIEGDAPISGVIPLYTVNAERSSGLIPLFIKGGISSYMNLFLKAADPIGYSGNMPLNIWGITAGSGNLFKFTSLYINGDASPSGSMNLFVGGYQDPIDVTSNMNLFMKTVGEYDANGVVVYPYTNQIPLIVYNNTISSGLSFYLEAPDSLPMSGSMNLVMWRQYEGLSSVVPLTLLGPSGINEDLTLYLQGQPNWRDSITMFISGVVNQTGDISLYSHGY